jgi:hypothetical protein
MAPAGAPAGLAASDSNPAPATPYGTNAAGAPVTDLPESWIDDPNADDPATTDEVPATSTTP